MFYTVQLNWALTFQQGDENHSIRLKLCKVNVCIFRSILIEKQQRSKKLHSNISKWSVYFFSFILFFLLQFWWFVAIIKLKCKSKMRILYFDWKSWKSKQREMNKRSLVDVCFFFLLLRHKLLNSTRSMNFGQFVVDPSINSYRNHNIGQLFLIPILNGLNSFSLVKLIQL